MKSYYEKLVELKHNLHPEFQETINIFLDEALRRQNWERAVERELRNLNPGMGELA